jgi:hypothetical protein
MNAMLIDEIRGPSHRWPREWGMSTAERIAWGLLSLIVLIALLRWLGTPEDQQKLKPPQVPKEKERQSGKSWSIGWLGAGLDQLGPLGALERSFEAGGEVIAWHVIDSHCGEFGMLKWQRLYCRSHSYQQRDLLVSINSQQEL